jgi:hypothetical protein
MDLRVLVKARRDHREACDTAQPRRANPAIALDETALLLKKKVWNMANEGSLSAVAIEDPEGLTL